MNKQKIVTRIRRELETVIAIRRSSENTPSSRAARIALRQFQSQRMAHTHSDWLATPESHAAARFFLDDLYGTGDLSQRDADLVRVVPAMERLLPVSALETVAEAAALDALSEKLDIAMARRLGEDFSADDYVAAYRQTGTHAERTRQIAHVESVGNALCGLVCVPLIGSTLAMMRGPAKMAGLGELQSFLERGFKAFKMMRKPHAFVATVVERERTVMGRLYSGAPNPFLFDAAAG